jgi:N-acetyl-1-D-myo-inositol-2-amino-2-deoxy-alpha-D-glucopyranoside deacetylase
MPISSQATLLFIGAHPDDETFGIGGTLAKYAARGAKAIYACATKGEVGSADEEHLRGFDSPADMRWSELKCAAGILGLADVVYLGYRDSGMPGSPDNHHPLALAAAPLEEVTARVVKVIRDLRPQVVITHDPIGGYRHPDHIAIHNATVRAFSAAGDPLQYPESGSAFTPQKLYFHTFPKTLFRIAVKVLPIFGQDPTHFGRNKDIDFASLAQVEFPVHAFIQIDARAADAKERASACHSSQLGGGPPASGLMGLAFRAVQNREMFMRAYPPVAPGQRVHETDLFEGVQN